MNDSTFSVFRSSTLCSRIQLLDRSKVSTGKLKIDGIARPNRFRCILPRAAVNKASKIKTGSSRLHGAPFSNAPQFTICGASAIQSLRMRTNLANLS
jgi:hypothetical protein